MCVLKGLQKSSTKTTQDQIKRFTLLAVSKVNWCAMLQHIFCLGKPCNYNVLPHKNISLGTILYVLYMIHLMLYIYYFHLVYQKLRFFLTRVSLTHFVITDNVTNSSFGQISVVCGSIWTFFTDLPSKIWKGSHLWCLEKVRRWASVVLLTLLYDKSSTYKIIKILKVIKQNIGSWVETEIASFSYFHSSFSKNLS